MMGGMMDNDNLPPSPEGFTSPDDPSGLVDGALTRLDDELARLRVAFAVLTSEVAASFCNMGLCDPQDAATWRDDLLARFGWVVVFDQTVDNFVWGEDDDDERGSGGVGPIPPAPTAPSGGGAER